MKTIFDLQTGVVTLLCTAALAGLTACEADPVMQESGKLPDKGSIEEVHVMLCSSNSERCVAAERSSVLPSGNS